MVVLPSNQVILKGAFVLNKGSENEITNPKEKGTEKKRERRGKGKRRTKYKP